MKKILGKLSSGIYEEEQPVLMPGLAYTTTGKTGFPNYYRGGLLKLFRKIPFGWEIRGKTKNYKCKICGKRAWVGRDMNNIFIFCKCCLIKNNI